MRIVMSLCVCFRAGVGGEAHMCIYLCFVCLCVTSRADLGLVLWEWLDLFKQLAILHVCLHNSIIVHHISEIGKYSYHTLGYLYRMPQVTQPFIFYGDSRSELSFITLTLICTIYVIHRIILGKLPTQDGSRNAYTFISGRWVGIPFSHGTG